MKKHLILIGILMALILGASACKGEGQESTGARDALLEVNTQTAVILQYKDESQTEYYRLEESSGLFALLEIETWTPAESAGELEKPYIVIRIGEGYEVALSSNGMAEIVNQYAAEEHEKEGTYQTSIDFETVLDYLDREAEPYDGNIDFLIS